MTVSIEFTDSLYYTGPALTDDMVAAAELSLGRRLPRAYVEVLRIQNGGCPTRCCLPTSFETSWARDHFEISAIRGIGGPWGVDGDGPLSSRALIREWAYPDIGVVICDMPSGGHDAVMLDYRSQDREPQVTYIDEDRLPRVVAPTFASFVESLRDCRDEAL
ncbi:SMI1/KNR4 family protein [Phycicoccus sp. HDW14]|nr:SMI1/KNR4 family protein [Phycicoccus sp. HDW14]